MFWPGLGLGIGIGLAAGLLLGQLLLNVGLNTIQDTIEKVTYSLRFPRPPSDPKQVEVITETAFDPQEVDQERMPDWMSEEYVP